ncbi:MAG: T9SS type A sorting domain-containing protein [Flavobacteriia bacterium]|nr:T9SS type A sorting domain-containing protein [Flavobacteriia bacterium]NCT61093.1 T9SS type A sorting domain-containing protein [Flavobacteriia bacterium]
MKRKQFWLLLSLILTASFYAQDEIDCDYNFKVALSKLYLSQDFRKDSLEITQLLDICVLKNDDKAQLLLGKFYTNLGDSKSFEKAFELLNKSAKNGNSMAMAELGSLYKYGKGCDLNFNKARNWFKKGAELNDDKSSYSLGYLYLKGFGNISQNYTKAIKWLEKSQHPMAKYWLGVCYYYGYGVEKNVLKANELLGTNFEEIHQNSNTPNESVDSNTNDITNLIDDSENQNTSLDVSESNLLGKWKGNILKYDWSGKHVEQKHAVIVEFKNDSITQLPMYSLKILDQVITGNINLYNNVIFFDDNKLKLPHNSFNEKIPSELNYDFLSGDLSLKFLNETTFLIGNIDSYIPEFNEPGAPMKFVLSKVETFSNSNEEISDEILEAIAKQEESFIKLYPNPFQDDLIISYTLEKPSFVEVKITNVNGTENTIVRKGENQKKGKHSYFFDGSNLNKGAYIVSVFVDNSRKTRIIIKK